MVRFLVAVGLAVSLVACGPPPSPPPPLTPASADTPSQDAPQTSPHAVSPVATTSRAPSAKPSHGKVVPKAIRIPSIGVNGTRFMPLGLLRDRSLQVPSVHTPRTAGWYTGAPIPGNPGSAIVVAHVDGDHVKGLFYRLSEVKVGDLISVDRSDGKTATFTVTKTGKYCKDQAGCPAGEAVFPTSSFYSNQSQAELHLDTCGGRYDPAHRNYLEAIVVWSKLVSVK